MLALDVDVPVLHLDIVDTPHMEPDMNIEWLVMDTRIVPVGDRVVVVDVVVVVVECHIVAKRPGQRLERRLGQHLDEEHRVVVIDGTSQGA